jgi:hypothetical protein
MSQTLQTIDNHSSNGSSHLAVPEVRQSDLMVMNSNDVIARMRHIQHVREAVMIEGVHFGKPFGDSQKFTLLKPGAEVLTVTFGLAVEPIINDVSTSDEIRYRVMVKLTSIATGAFIGSGIGECSSNEEKYKWRAAVAEEEYNATPVNRRRMKFKKNRDAISQIMQVRTEPADIANTVLKMAKKRALIDATLTATGASDMFEQDLDDLPYEIIDAISEERGQRAEKAKPQPQHSAPGGLKAYTKIKSVEIKKGDKWTRFDITGEDGVRYPSFNEAHGTFAQKAKAEGFTVEIIYESNEKGKKVVAISKAVEPPKEEVKLQPETAEHTDLPGFGYKAAGKQSGSVDIDSMNVGHLLTELRKLGIAKANIEQHCDGRTVSQFTPGDIDFTRETLKRLHSGLYTVDNVFD